jgi:hypothetical protein
VSVLLVSVLLAQVRHRVLVALVLAVVAWVIIVTLPMVQAKIAALVVTEVAGAK